MGLAGCGGFRPRASSSNTSPVEVTAIYAPELGIPKNRERIEWKLLTGIKWEFCQRRLSFPRQPPVINV